MNIQSSGCSPSMGSSRGMGSARGMGSSRGPSPRASASRETPRSKSQGCGSKNEMPESAGRPEMINSGSNNPNANQPVSGSDTPAELPDSKQGQQIESSVVPGLNVFTGSQNDAAAAEQLLQTIEQGYTNDPDYKAAVDAIISKYGSANVTVADIEPAEDGRKVLGLALINGNEINIDTGSVTDQATIAHEILHNLGLEHGPDEVSSPEIENGIREMLT